LADANRDPESFPDPHTLRLERRPAGHLAFGAGPHACPGSALIRQAAQPAVARFATHFAGREIRFEAVPEPGVTVRSLRSLLIQCRFAAG
jgi:cytochrome P450